MPASLTRELSYELDGFVFGENTPYVVENIEIGGTDTVSHDADIPRADGIRFGRDYRTNRVITFEVVINSDPYPPTRSEPLDLLGDMEKAWSGDTFRTSPGRVTWLAMRRGNRIRRVYGRPRRFAVAGERDRAGWVTVTADFVTVDHLFYSDSDTVITVPLVPPSSGGFPIPFVFPWSTTAITSSVGVVTVVGNHGSWPVFSIYGPVVNPVVLVTGEWQIALSITMLAGQYAVIDTRPWSRGVTSHTGANLAGAITTGSPRLAEARLTPGTHEIVLSGQDETGTALLSLSMTDAHYSF